MRLIGFPQEKRKSPQALGRPRTPIPVMMLLKQDASRTGKRQRLEEPNGNYLRQVRNEFGPSWLMKYRLPR
jgi:hypothetical protein